MAVAALRGPIEETTTTTGTGTYTLGGAIAGRVAFGARYADAAEVYYTVEGLSGGAKATEIGRGTLGGSGTTLARTEVIESTNGDAAVDWDTGTKRIYGNLPAPRFLLPGTADGNVPAFASSALALAGKLLRDLELREFRETIQTVTATTSTTIDLSAGSVIILEHGTNVTTLVIDGATSGKWSAFVIDRRKDASGTVRALAGPSGVVSPGGEALDLTQTTGARDIIVGATDGTTVVWAMSMKDLS